MTPLNRRGFLKAAGAGVGTLAIGADRLVAGQRSPIPRRNRRRRRRRLRRLDRALPAGDGLRGHVDRPVRARQFARDLGR